MTDSPLVVSSQTCCNDEDDGHGGERGDATPHPQM